MFPLLLLPALAAAAPAAAPAQSPIAIPLVYKYGDYPKISAEIQWGTPPQSPITTVIDLGSTGFWVYGPNATIRSGDTYSANPCISTPDDFFAWPASTSASGPRNLSGSYIYGTGNQAITGSHAVNDTLAFANPAYPAVPNTQVEIADAASIRPWSLCSGWTGWDRSILGLYPLPSYDSGPSFRAGLGGGAASRVMSMWFDAAPADTTGTFEGTVLFGAAPEGKYGGELVSVALDRPDVNTGYYVARPTLAVGGGEAVAVVDGADSYCLVDSGTGSENLPVTLAAFLEATGLEEIHGRPGYWGGCEELRNRTLEYTFAAADGGEGVTVRAPLSNYARGLSESYDDTKDGKACLLSFGLDSSDCTLGAPFFTSAFMAFDDEKGEISVAQGGVSTGAVDGVNA